MLVIWFNPTECIFYSKFYKNYNSYQVGSTNSYGHMVVLMNYFCHRLNKFVKCSSYYDYYSRLDTFNPSVKQKIKDRLISFINNL